MSDAPERVLGAELAALKRRLDILEKTGGARQLPPLAGFSSVARARLAMTIQLVADEYQVFGPDLTGEMRSTDLIRPRFVLAWLIRHSTPFSLPRIGQMLGKRDHTTIMNALRRVEQWRAADADFTALSDALLVAARAFHPTREVTR